MYTYKENLLQYAKYIVDRIGGKIRVRGSGNNRKVAFYTKRSNCVVWFPVDSRVNNLEIADMKEAIKFATGFDAFQDVPAKRGGK